MAGNGANAFANETEEEFIARMSGNISGGLACIVIAMGIETGLLKHMVSLGEEPKTSQEIAEAGNYKERYVREWLGGMVANGIVEYNAKDKTYWLPAHRHCIAGTVRATALTMAIPNLCSAFFDVAECFQKDGPRGVSYDKYGKFDDMMTSMNQEFFTESFVQSFLPTMPRVVQQLQQGIQVLEIGCSQGIGMRVIAQSFPNSQVYGVDISEDGIKHAQEKAKEMGLGNAHFLCMSATALPADWSEKFDFVFMHNVLHDLSYPFQTLQELHRVLRIGGTMSVIDPAAYSNLEDNLSKIPEFSRDVYVLSMMNCVPTSLSSEGGEGLGALWGREKAQEMMKDAQFEVISVCPVAKRSSLHYQCQKLKN